MTPKDSLNQSNYSFFFLIVDNFLDINLYPHLKNFYPIYAYKNKNLSILKEQHIPYFCLEEQGINLQEKNSARLLSQKEVQEYISQQSQKDQKKAAIIPFKPASKIEKICQDKDWTLISNPRKLNLFFEDKLNFVKICQEAKIPILPSTQIQLNQVSFQEAQSNFGQNLVIQSSHGWAGNSTHLVSSYQEALTLYPEFTPLKVSPLKEGYSLLNNAVIISNQLIQSPPALQFTGLSPFTSHPFTTVGRQWPSLAPQHVISQVKDLTQKFSQVLINHDYKGFFGLDFFVSEDQVFLLECNPRLTASFAFYTQLELDQNLNPLFFFHLLSFIENDYPVDANLENNRFNNPQIIGSEITSKDQHQVTIKKYNQNIAFTDSIKPIKIKEHILEIFK